MATMETLKKNIDETIGSYHEVISKYLEIIEKCYDENSDLVFYIMEDVIDSYSKLMQQRKECVDKYLKFYSLSKIEKDIDVSKPIKSLLEKQQEDIERWQQEIAPLLELTKMNENTSDEKANEVLDMFKNL